MVGCYQPLSSHWPLQLPVLEPVGTESLDCNWRQGFYIGTNESVVQSMKRMQLAAIQCWLVMNDGFLVDSGDGSVVANGWSLARSESHIIAQSQPNPLLLNHLLVAPSAPDCSKVRSRESTDWAVISGFRMNHKHQASTMLSSTAIIYCHLLYCNHLLSGIASTIYHLHHKHEALTIYCYP